MNDKYIVSCSFGGYGNKIYDYISDTEVSKGDKVYVPNFGGEGMKTVVVTKVELATPAKLVAYPFELKSILGVANDSE